MRPTFIIRFTGISLTLVDCVYLINTRRQPLNAIVKVLSFFLQFEEFELYWGAVFFTTRRGVVVIVFYKVGRVVLEQCKSMPHVLKL